MNEFQLVKRCTNSGPRIVKINPYVIVELLMSPNDKWRANVNGLCERNDIGNSGEMNIFWISVGLGLAAAAFLALSAATVKARLLSGINYA